MTVHKLWNVRSFIILVAALAVEAIEIKFIYLRTCVPPTEISASTPAADLQALFNSNEPLKVIIPNWLETLSSESAITLTASYLTTAVNIVQVDWTAYGLNAQYTSVLDSVPDMGAELLTFLEAMTVANVTTYAACHLIGYGLGAHIAGSAAPYLSSASIGRITGLDPSGFGYDGGDPANFLDKTDAAFVDSIHTSAGYAGYSGQLAHLDFYPNGGTVPQPNCDANPSPVFCSQEASFKLFAASILNVNLYCAYSYPSWPSFIQAGCAATTPVLMGEGASPTAPDGTYYLLTDGALCQ